MRNSCFYILKFFYLSTINPSTYQLKTNQPFNQNIINLSTKEPINQKTYQLINQKPINHFHHNTYKQTIYTY